MKYLVYTILIIIAFGFTGCNYLDAVPEKDIQTVESIFEQRKGAEQWRRGLYASANLLFADACRNMSFFGADELVVNEYMKNDATVAGIKISEGLQMAQTPYGDVWASVYNIIRDCNTFLDNIDNVYNMKNTEKRMWEADVKALKAYLYFELVRRYGPIVFGCKDTHFPPNIVCLSENHYKNRQIICLIRNFANFCMIYRDSSHLHLAYHYILLK